MGSSYFPWRVLFDRFGWVKGSGSVQFSRGSVG